MMVFKTVNSMFQHSAARRRLELCDDLVWRLFEFQHSAARRRLACPARPHCRERGFNTQPPEGGWLSLNGFKSIQISFNTQPPEGGWVPKSHF